MALGHEPCICDYMISPNGVVYITVLFAFLGVSSWWAYISDAPVTEMSVRAIPIRMVILALLFFLFVGPTTHPIGAVVTGSMQPTIQAGDMVVASAVDNPNPVVDSEIYPAATSAKPQLGGKPGSVVVFQTFLDRPVTHRVRYQVDAGDNWIRVVNDSYLPSGAECDIYSNCPAPMDGYITRGDNNLYYDQVGEIGVVARNDIYGVVKLRIPFLGELSKSVYQRSTNTTAVSE